MDDHDFENWYDSVLEAGDIGWAGQSVRVAGEPMHYVAVGEGQPVVLLHGFLEWSYSWRGNLAPLAAAGYRTVAPDLRGHGLSGKDYRLGHSLDDQVDLLVRFLDAVGADRIVLCGHSMGGEISLRFALAYPDRVRALVLVSASGYLQVKRHGLNQLLLKRPELGAAVVGSAVLNRRFVRRALRQAYHPLRPVSEHEVDAYMVPARAPGAARTFLRLLGDVDFGRQAGRYSEIAQPALLVWGSDDRVVPLAHGAQLARDLPDSKLTVFERCGHHPHVEYPERFNRELLAFLSDRVGQPEA